VRAAVVTTIQAPTPSLLALAKLAGGAGVAVFVVGDRKTPAGAWPEPCQFLSLDRQRESTFRLARLLPENHYGRKNVGYLEAMARGAQAIFETDDDNAPLAGWTPRSLRALARPVRASGWFNVYRCFSSGPIWPRGFPLEYVREAAGDLSSAAPETMDAPVQQALVNGSPDVDAVWRLLQDRPFEFVAADSVWLGPGAWCPFNSQSTWWFTAAYPLMYLPSKVSFRMTDIWRSFVAQRCLWELGLGVVFHGPDMIQDRNPHDLLRDFEQEIPGYLGNARLCAVLLRINLASGAANLGSNLHRCYEGLVGAGFIDPEEMKLVEAWLEDVG
jgi:hypothetical protein